MPRRTAIAKTTAGGAFSSAGFSASGFYVYSMGGSVGARRTRLVTLLALATLLIFGG